MTRLWFALAGIALVLGLGWTALHYRSRAQAAEAEAARYQTTIRLRAQQDARQAIIRAEAAALDHDLAEQEGADAPLSDYLRNAAGKLWP